MILAHILQKTNINNFLKKLTVTQLLFFFFKESTLYNTFIPF